MNKLIIALAAMFAANVASATTEAKKEETAPAAVEAKADAHKADAHKVEEKKTEEKKTEEKKEEEKK